MVHLDIPYMEQQALGKALDMRGYTSDKGFLSSSIKFKMPISTQENLIAYCELSWPNSKESCLHILSHCSDCTAYDLAIKLDKPGSLDISRKEWTDAVFPNPSSISYLSGNWGGAQYAARGHQDATIRMCRNPELSLDDQAMAIAEVTQFVNRYAQLNFSTLLMNSLYGGTAISRGEGRELTSVLDDEATLMGFSVQSHQEDDIGRYTKLMLIGLEQLMITADVQFTGTALEPNYLLEFQLITPSHYGRQSPDYYSACYPSVKDISKLKFQGKLKPADKSEENEPAGVERFKLNLELDASSSSIAAEITRIMDYIATRAQLHFAAYANLAALQVK